MLKPPAKFHFSCTYLGAPVPFSDGHWYRSWCVQNVAALVGGVALGLANPTLGCLADSYNLSKFSTFGIFAIAGKKRPYIFSLFDVLWDGTYILCHKGLTLRTEEIGATAEAWPVGLFGLVCSKHLSACHCLILYCYSFSLTLCYHL